VCLSWCQLFVFVFGWQDGVQLWRRLLLHQSLQAGCKQGEWCLFIMENGGLALKQRESISFCNFWHFNDDFAQYNTTKTISKAEKAP
jgi:hypothetical protein